MREAAAAGSPHPPLSDRRRREASKPRLVKDKSEVKCVGGVASSGGGAGGWKGKERGAEALRLLMVVRKHGKARCVWR